MYPYTCLNLKNAMASLNSNKIIIYNRILGSYQEERQV